VLNHRAGSVQQQEITRTQADDDLKNRKDTKEKGSEGEIQMSAPKCLGYEPDASPKGWIRRGRLLWTCSRLDGAWINEFQMLTKS
jgi:hypothetical protein